MSFLQALHGKGLISRKESERLSQIKKDNEPLYLTAVRMGVVSEDDYLAVASEFFRIGITDALPEYYEAGAFSDLAHTFLEEHLVFPLSSGPREIILVVHDPLCARTLDVLGRFYPGRSLRLLLAREETIRSWIRVHFGGSDGPAEEGGDDGAGGTDIEGLRDLASEAPVIKAVNQILTRAVEIGASDIHIEPFADRVQVRFRADGLLYEHESLPKRMLQGVTTRIKIMSQLDISERRLPQDGRIQLKIAGRNVDLRVSCLPVMFGESIVLRILDKQSISFSLGSLGFPDRELEAFNRLIRQPYGIILVTGPTGSGKTTTLYSALNDINSSDKKIITVEDPVEYELEGINQVQVNNISGLSFAKGLRSIVRQDPDVILIGEIRDQETADIAIQSALTGHLVSQPCIRTTRREL
jgi:general secretion pathway protein E